MDSIRSGNTGRIDRRENVRSPLRRFLVRLLRKALYRADRFDAFSARCAVVFSPHPDDETLGCGGVIARKVNSGAEIAVVFMTSGTASHSAILPKDQLRLLREGEARRAAQVLGLPAEESLHFLGLTDGKLSAVSDLHTALLPIIDRYRPGEIFVPARWDTTPDHRATCQAVYQALQRYPAPVVIWEYPVWFWTHWPFAPLPVYGVRPRMEQAAQAFVSTFRLTHFTHPVCIRPYRHTKLAALLKYNSQMTRFIPSPRWLTLKNVARGEFLECFLQDWEIFRPSFWDGTTLRG